MTTEQSLTPQTGRGFLRTLKTSRAAIGTAAILALAGILWLGWQFKTLRDETIHIGSHDQRLIELAGKIVHLDEVLTMSARMAAATLNLSWEDRYHHFEQSLADAIQESRRLDPGGMAEFITQTDMANQRLVEMERRAFDLVRGKNPAAATALLFSPEYERQKQLYADGIKKLTASVGAHVRAAMGAHERRMRVAFVAVLAVLSILVLFWVALLRANKDRIEAERRARQTAEQARDDLERRIAEATRSLKQEIEVRATLFQRQEGINHLQQSLLVSAPLDQKLKRITDAIVRLFDADFCRIWLIRPGDLCGKGCIHAGVQEGPHVCHSRDRCLHLQVSSGRYTHIDGMNHRRVPFGCYKIGRIASGEDHKFITNDVQNDPNVHSHEWARDMGLVSFAGYQLRVPGQPTMGVLGLFAKHPITPTDDVMLDELSNTVARVIRQALADESLKEATTFLDTLLKAIPVPVFYKDSEGRYLGFNKTFEEFFGKTNEELVGKSVFDISPRELAEVYHAKDRELFEHPGVQVYDSTVKDAHGRLHDVVYHKATFTDANGNVLGLIGAILDITERKQAEKDRLELARKLLQTQKLESLGVLAGGIAHDFNNLLMAILGNLDMAGEDLPPASSARQNVEEALRAAMRAADLTRQMLAYSGQGKFVTTEINLNDLVQENANTVSATFAKTATLKLELGPHLAPIIADAEQVQQVLMNLITNASEAIGNNPGTIRITTGVSDYDADGLAKSCLLEKPDPGRFVWLEVADTGCGMDEVIKARIFDPFFTTKFTGRGLGMSAVQGVIKGHHGTIFINSEIGKGSAIRVLFPVQQTQDAPANMMSKPTADTGTDPRSTLLSGTVLVVDDEFQVRKLCASMLARFGLKVLQAEDGDAAVMLFREHPDDIQCVLLDLTMPKMDGAATFKALRQIRPDARVILSSGYDEQEIMRRFEGQGLSGFIQKPYHTKALRALLERILGAP